MIVSLILPCLNERGSLSWVISRARRVAGEILMVDNGSTDGSAAAAKKLGVRVLTESRRGYGYAIRRGLTAARGDVLIIADADGTYDPAQIKKFVSEVQSGNDVVIGSRIKGEIVPGAMPFSHRFIGVPLLTFLVNILYGTRLSDVHCGIRACTKKAFRRMHLTSGGMEFASEFVIAAKTHNLAIAEVPVRYLPRRGKSKLRAIRDAGRHVAYIFGKKFGFI